MAQEVDNDDLWRSAVVFSPHFDDETLGCGGTIRKKKNAGANITIVFMTDGSKSHHQFIREDELMKIRSDECVAAAKVLGIAACDIIKLCYEETKLNEHADAATRHVTDLLCDKQPLDLFIPYQGDSQPDHQAANRIVNAALLRYAKRVTVYEYPIWYWQQWPFVSSPSERYRRLIKGAILSAMRYFRDFRWRVSITKQLADKRAALEQYRSQMTRMNSDPSWPVLSDVSCGEFLRCFFQDYELFTKRIFIPDRLTETTDTNRLCVNRD